MILGNSGLHFANKVGTNVGGLGVNTAAHTGEECNRGSTKGEASDDVHYLRDAALIMTKLIAKDGEESTQTEHAETDHTHAHHRTTGKGHAETLAQTFARGVGGAHIGFGRHLHADVTRQRGAKRAHDEGNGRQRRGVLTLQTAEDQQHGNAGHEDRQHFVFCTQEGHGALLNGLGYTHHFWGARILFANP